MAETISFTRGAPRDQIYSELVPQLRDLVKGEPDVTANLANIAAALKEAFGFLWIGFYLLKKGELVLGPFQGPVACTRIEVGKGVVGTAFEKAETLIIPNVDEFPGHIACSADSRSEIVVPVYGKPKKPKGVLDIDSNLLHDFTEVDSRGLVEVCEVVREVLTGENV
ncbi:MAG: GAF domain-containing protein [Acidobacteria bacterium]|nr:MAG: GAF domain-containing protein [Acidobacteriota bacterium]REK04003.1 MAG: GAF domain-containing protein [Acidobacteriota bacterium]REK15165.1 MAG: GAF domain-containing protein [Acidobacteriota bacterium]REK46255.1 MAG: GAF domain-containing protein [Acidobacteriota bacterium]